MLRTSSLLNAELLAALASAGHGQRVVIADAGLPIPPAARIIDLSLTPGIPGFAEVARAVLDNGVFERCIVAEESIDAAPMAAIQSALADLPRSVVDHTALKELLADAHVIVRTGECTPFANIVLVAGTTF